MRRRIYDLNERTQAFAVRVLKFAKSYPASPMDRPALDQLVRASGSVHANQRAARRSRSDKELVAKLSIANEEADECVGWFQTLQKAATPAQRAHNAEELEALLQEAGELAAIYGKGRMTAKARLPV